MKFLFIQLQFIKQTFTLIRKHKLNYALGFSACLVVVFTVSLLVSVLSKTPLIFLRLAELENGELDLWISAGSWTGFSKVNYSLVEKLLDKEETSYHSPRHEVSTNFYKYTECGSSVGPPYSLDWKYTGTPSFSCINRWECLPEICKARIHTSRLFLIDSDREKRMNLGRDWNQPKIPKGTVYVQRSLSTSLNISIGDTLILDLNGAGIVGTEIWKETIGSIKESDNNARRVFLTVNVSSIYDSAGKYEVDITDGMLMEYGDFISYLALSASPLILSTARQNLSKLDLYEFADSVIINLPPPRIAPYLNSNYDAVQKNIVDFASGILYKIGFNQLVSYVPILEGLSSSRYFSLFLGLILNLIIFVLLFLSILLIYSLLMINVETRTFEMGVFRMLGTTRVRIISLLLYQAFAYSIPSWVAGLIFARIAAIFVTWKLTSVTGVPISAELSLEGVLSATALGLVIPIFASILPIRNALGQNLQTSLDTKHSRTKAVAIKIERSEEGGAISWTVVVIGSALALFGIGIYYIFPLALLSLNLGLLLNMFFFLLIGMLLGLSLLALNTQHLLEKLVVVMFIWWDSRAIRTVVQKNLVAHRIRNRKTTIMYSLSLGFIIFITVSYSVQLATFKYERQQANGAYLKVTASGYYPDGTAHSIVSKDALEKISLEHPKILRHAWITHRITNSLPLLQRTILSNLGRLYTAINHVQGVSANFFDTTIDGFLKVSNTNYNDKDLDDVLYTINGSSQALVGSYYQTSIGLNLESKFLLTLDESKIPFQIFQDSRQIPQATSGDNIKMMTALAFLDSAPAFDFSSFPQRRSQSFVVSLPTFLRMCGNYFSSVDEIPMKNFIIKLSDDATNQDLDKIKRSLKEATQNDRGVEVWDYRDSIGPIQRATKAMNYFFTFTTVIAMLICFFSLMSSMFTNIHEQTKEIAILRSLGVRKFWMYRIYVYEAFVLVFSSSLLGIMIGYAVGYTMTLQRILFTELPISFEFPYTIVSIVFLFSIGFGFLASFSPIRSVLSMRIVQIFRILT